MHSRRFDLLAKRLAARTDRRSILRVALSGLIGATTLPVARPGATAAAQTDCGFGQTLCSGGFGGGQCVNTSFDNDNCGSCGNRCPFGTSCQNGVCPNPNGCTAGDCGCSFGRTYCPGSFGGLGDCVNLDTDDFNCGSCGFQCPSGTSCNFGVCECRFGQTFCPGIGYGECVNLDSDRNNCGFCGNVCPGSASCSLGVCACRPGRTLCQTGFTTVDCVDTSFSDDHCGACGIVCPGSSTCAQGVCECRPGYILCPTGFATVDCVDPSSDDQNCGACGVTCPADNRCLSGQCTEQPHLPSTNSPPTPTLAPASALAKMLPSQRDVPQGLVVTDEGSREPEIVALLFPSRSEGYERLSEWDWQENVYRIFTAGDGEQPPSGTTYLQVSIHRFGGTDGASEAVSYLSDRRAADFGLDPTPVSLLGDESVALQGIVQGETEFSVYLRLGSISALVSARSPQGDPTNDALDVAEVVVAKCGCTEDPPLTPTPTIVPNIDLQTLLPAETDVPHGLSLDTDGTLTPDQVLPRLTTEPDARLADWGWQDGRFRTFTSPESAGTYTGTIRLEVTLYRFDTAARAATAMRALADTQAQPLHLTPTTIAGLGGPGLTLTTTKPIQFTFYVQFQTVVAVVYATSPTSDPTSDALTVTRVIARNANAP